ncbi:MULTISPECIES: pyocin knob domain-containing protein [Lysinibacillus]|uniref:pyocin knob domain-containing protein n=1 Tax=Lysinibacillus TaxID=400634 RepID=UPI00214BFA34|nr:MULTISPECIES: pyocin knob domain-containing protein [Lysinibacillus]UUV23835.1 pyocin knob domain-containing protein [Lysinibacillus sp. FN11]UYB46707.1 pyocin knob domain-containing protein [Lysinibacillus capsici]
MIDLNVTGDNWNRNQRNGINENWQRIKNGLSNLQGQIKILAGGEEVDELLKRLNDAVESATVAVQESIDANNTATQDAITANNQALQIALNTIGAALTDVGNAIQAAETATNDAMEAKDAALQAAGDAQTTISQMQVIISNFRPRGEWNATTDYFKNNLAGLNGKTYIALQNNTNKPVTDTSFWMLFADRGAKGERGEKGEPGTGIKVLGHFNDVSELPSNPTLGDAYTIGADRDLYVYNGNDWQNLGSIKGVEGKSAYEVAVENGFVGTEIEWLETLIGPPGPDGPPGPPADLTEINQKVDGLQNEVTEHLGQMATTEVAGHVMLVNDLITGGADKAASADTVKALKTNQDMIEQTLGSKFHVAIDYFSGDLDVLKKDGFYKGYNFTNGAEISISVILVKSYSPDWIVQIQYTVGTRPLMYIRAFHSGTTWTAWNRIMDKIDYDQLFTSVSNGKATVNQAVTDMGVYTAPDAPFATTAANIKVIPKGKTVQESTMNVPSFSGTGQVQVDVTFAGGTVRNAMVQCGGVLFIHGLYYGNAQVSSGLYVSNIEFIGSTVRFTFRLGSGLGNWVGGSIRYTITS